MKNFVFLLFVFSCHSLFAQMPSNSISFSRMDMWKREYDLKQHRLFLPYHHSFNGNANLKQRSWALSYRKRMKGNQLRASLGGMNRNLSIQYTGISRGFNDDLLLGTILSLITLNPLYFIFGARNGEEPPKGHVQEIEITERSLQLGFGYDWSWVPTEDRLKCGWSNNILMDINTRTQVDIRVTDEALGIKDFIQQEIKESVNTTEFFWQTGLYMQGILFEDRLLLRWDILGLHIPLSQPNKHLVEDKNIQMYSAVSIGFCF